MTLGDKNDILCGLQGSLIRNPETKTCKSMPLNSIAIALLRKPAFPNPGPSQRSVMASTLGWYILLVKRPKTRKPWFAGTLCNLLGPSFWQESQLGWFSDIASSSRSRRGFTRFRPGLNCRRVVHSAKQTWYMRGSPLTRTAI